MLVGSLGWFTSVVFGGRVTVIFIVYLLGYWLLDMGLVFMYIILIKYSSKSGDKVSVEVWADRCVRVERLTSSFLLPSK